MHKIVVFASGGGSNFQAIIEAIEQRLINAEIVCLIVDRPCNASERAKRNGIPYLLVPRSNNQQFNSDILTRLCQAADLIVLAGYLTVLDADFINSFPNKIINIHPSLLPAYGGPGMYGLKIHQAVIEAGDAVSGCTVHYVNEELDGGEIIAQEVVSVSMLDSAESLRDKIIEKEHALLIYTIKQLLEGDE